eukprot:m.421930 g.421930  ORF g.421930 m.421930 type:complete len:64 (-) comp16850_c0_seq7:179-370(-)
MGASSDCDIGMSSGFTKLEVCDLTPMGWAGESMGDLGASRKVECSPSLLLEPTLRLWDSAITR